MSFYKFDEDDLFLNTVQTYPQNKFYIQSGSVYINNQPHISGANTDNIIGVPRGFISLYEYNIDRPANNSIYPFVYKDASKNSFKSYDRGAWDALPYIDATTGEATKIISSYNMSASISRFYIDPPDTHGSIYKWPGVSFIANTTGSIIASLENIFNHYSYISPHYQYSSSLGDKSEQTGSLITIPSIAYGSNIKKGTVSLKYYITGTLVGELSDYRQNGDLIQIGPEGSTGSGSVAGSILYNEGFIFLTGSWDLDSHSIKYDNASATTSKWIHFGYGMHDAASIALTTLSASYSLDFSGSSQFQTMTMLAHATYNELNHSTNPTFVSSSNSFSVSTGSYQYVEQAKQITNVVSSSFTDEDPKFEKTVYLSKIGIYDKDKNLIGIAKMATPVRKTEADQYTFKLKLDI
tara:strand:- start:4482 stop:5705 length:1224 start_codon:yes stop_codon:yes gene_type:complete